MERRTLMLVVDGERTVSYSKHVFVDIPVNATKEEIKDIDADMITTTLSGEAADWDVDKDTGIQPTRVLIAEDDVYDEADGDESPPDIRLGHNEAGGLQVGD